MGLQLDSHSSALPYSRLAVANGSDRLPSSSTFCHVKLRVPLLMSLVLAVTWMDWGVSMECFLAIKALVTCRLLMFISTLFVFG